MSRVGSDIYHDTSGTIPDGDAFTFAEQHYHLTGDDLLAKLAEDLHLRKHESTDNEKTEIPVFSFFRAPITSTVPYKSITLFEAYLYIIGKPAQKRTADLRAITDKTQAKRFKSNCFDYCCFSGIFTKRNANALVQHSGLMCIDFDHLPDPDDLRQKLLFDEYFDTQCLGEVRDWACMWTVLLDLRPVVPSTTSYNLQLIIVV